MTNTPVPEHTVPDVVTMPEDAPDEHTVLASYGLQQAGRCGEPHAEGGGPIELCRRWDGHPPERHSWQIRDQLNGSMGLDPPSLSPPKG